MSPRRGAAATEFALWLPFVLLLLGGIVDLGRMASLAHAVERAARDGARTGAATTKALASSDPPEGLDIETAAIAQARQILLDSGLACADGCDVQAAWITGGEGWRLIRVEVTVPFVPVVGLADTFARPIGADFTMLTQFQP